MVTIGLVSAAMFLMVAAVAICRAGARADEEELVAIAALRERQHR